MNRPAGNTPTDLYEQGLARGDWQRDPAQTSALQSLDRIHSALIESRPDSLFEKIGAAFRDNAPIQGMYLWGGVGRGKTFLTDLLFASLPEEDITRWHFHRFMQDIHARLRLLTNTEDTLSVVAKDLAKNTRLLILDEFFVSDIGDAMILGRLLDQLFARGVCLVTTSNIPPQELYRDGLQRSSFLPAIALLEKNCTVLKLESVQDYRLRHLAHAATYVTPIDENSGLCLTEHYRRLSQHHVGNSTALKINDREIIAKAISEGVTWFEFSELCEGPRAVSDYIELARNFHTVLISNVPRFTSHNEDPARRFVHLVDEFYDRHVNLILSAEADPVSLYQGEKLEREFERTSSRLIEMQSMAYLA
ncbi:MAG: cell division protein ZapE, partial [Arenimonas sp.]